MTRDIEYVVGKIEGDLVDALPHVFVVGTRNQKLTYIGKTKIPFLINSHMHVADWAGLEDVLGGGECELKNGTLRFYGNSVIFGAVPKIVLEKFDLLTHYQKLYSEVKSIDIAPNERAVKQEKWRGMI